MLQNEDDEFGAPFEMGGPEGEAEWKQLTPGKYRLYAFEDFDPDAWGNPELAPAFASKSLELELKENEHARVKAPLISAKEFQTVLQRLGN